MARRTAGFFACAAFALAGCGSDPTFPPRGLDAGLECTEGFDAGVSQALSCPAGDVCLQGRCYDACSSDSECAPSEMCEGGVCTDRSRPRVDGGPTDGSMDPCSDVMCTAPMTCHPRGGVCVECLGSTCPGATPTCDVAYGVCRPFRSGVCAPCNVDGDCSDGMTVFGTCEMLDADYERVCVPSCAGGETCPAGMQCDSMGRCLPRVGSCTGLWNANTGRACNSDAECVPLGSIAAAGQCVGLVPPTVDGGAPTPGVCRQPCGITETDCPASTTCSGGFCLPL